MAGVVLEGVSRVFPGPVVALDDVSLEVRDRELLTLVGPSGSGKTTLLRLIAGLEQPSQGEIRIAGRSVTRLAARDRDVAFVFQSYALYPHLTVRRLLASALELRWRVSGWKQWFWQAVSPARARRLIEKRNEIARRVQDTASLLGIDGLLDRRPGQLSGGQRQRVALGRALVRQPAVYLLDEPFSNIDERLRDELRRDLRQLQRSLGGTMVYVTHDRDEALALGDRVAVLSEGKLQQIGAPEELYEHPRNRFVAGFLGVPDSNFVVGRLEREGEQVRFVSPTWSVVLDRMTAVRVQPYLTQAVVLGLRPEDVSVVAKADSQDGVTARVVEVQPLAGWMRVCVVSDKGSVGFPGSSSAVRKSADVTLVSRTSARARMAAGDLVSMHLNMRQAHVFDPQTGENIGWPQVVEGN